KSKTSTWTLSGPNTYTGTTTISGGTLQLSGSGTLGATTNTLTLTGGFLDLNNTNQTVGALTGGPGGTLENNGGASSTVTLTIGNGDASGTYSGVIDAG